jgi:ribonuclease HI
MSNNKITINFDGSFNHNFISSAFVAKRNGEKIYEKVIKVVDHTSVHAEYHALKSALKWANDMFADEFETQQIEIIGDCKPVIDAVKFSKRLIRDEQYKSMVEYHAECRSLYDKLRRLHDVKLVWVPRYQNKEVDELSRTCCFSRSVVKQINMLLVDYLKSLKIHDIQSYIQSFMTFYTGKDSYSKMSNQQLLFFYERIKQLCSRVRVIFA